MGRAKIMGANQMVGGSVWLIGPALGGWLADAYGFQNSFIIAGLGAASCSVGYTFLQESLVRDSKAKKQPKFGDGGVMKELDRWWKDVRPLLGSSPQQALIALSCVPSFRWACFQTVVTLHASAVLGAGPKDIGLMFSALALAQGLAIPCGSYMADKASGAKLGVVIPAGLASC